MENDAISRSALLDSMPKATELLRHQVVDVICNTPALDVAPVVHAHWVYDPDGMDFNLGAWVCSRCEVKNDNLGGLQRINPYLFSGSRYCPNCGAKMDALRNDDVTLLEPPDEESDEQHPDGP